MTVSAGDERPHPPGAQVSWVETTWLELYDVGSDLAGVIRLDVRPNQGSSEVSFSFFLPDDGFVVARHVTPHAVGGASVVEIEDARLETVEPLHRWSVRYDGPSHSLASVADAGRREAWQKSRLERLIVELDVVAVCEAVPGDGSFAQPVRVTGEVWVSGDRYEVSAPGLRGRAWRDGVLARRASYVALSFDDDRVVFARVETRAGTAGTEEAVEGFTSVGGEVRPVRALRVEHAAAGPGGLPAVTIHLRDDAGEHRIAADLPHVAPMAGLYGTRSYELRLAVTHARWDGREGHGFLEELE